MNEEHFSKRDKRVYDHLLEFGSITSWEAIKEYGNTRLSDSIYHLRKKGHSIVNEQESSVNRYGEKVSYVRYRLDD